MIASKGWEFNMRDVDAFYIRQPVPSGSCGMVVDDHRPFLGGRRVFLDSVQTLTIAMSNGNNFFHANLSLTLSPGIMALYKEIVSQDSFDVELDFVHGRPKDDIGLLHNLTINETPVKTVAKVVISGMRINEFLTAGSKDDMVMEFEVAGSFESISWPEFFDTEGFKIYEKYSVGVLNPNTTITVPVIFPKPKKFSQRMRDFFGPPSNPANPY